METGLNVSHPIPYEDSSHVTFFRSPPLIERPTKEFSAQWKSSKRILVYNKPNRVPDLGGI
jgi:hypothetical protein